MFDGSGGFPLGGMMAGVIPVWAAEIEPFPIRVTTKRLPFMKHYGDVTKINGGEIEPVDIITFGSPCQNLSQAGTRSGLSGERSSLFFEAIRIIKEMREATNGQKPVFIVFENVYGAFSSNKGEDFRQIIESVCRIKDEGISIPRPEKWENAGGVAADGYSVAWRTLNAEYWGIPQRRRRVYLVADLAGERAGKILYESEGVSGYSPQSSRSWKKTAGGTDNDLTQTSTDSDGVMIVENYPNDSRVKIREDRVFQTLSSWMGTGGNNVPMVIEPDKEQYQISYGLDRACFNQGVNAKYDITVDEELQPPLVARGPNGVAHPVAYSIGSGQICQMGLSEKARTLDCMHDHQSVMISEGSHKPKYIIRRITPLECARLQGFPDWWCNGLETEEPTDEEISFWRRVFDTYAEIYSKKPKTDKQMLKWLKDPRTDAAEYKMWGNGVALPCVYFVLSGIKWAETLPIEEISYTFTPQKG